MDTLPSAAASLAWHFDPELLRRHDRPGPRYTSYPAAPHFHDGFGEAQLRAALAASNHRARPLSLYVHVPYCSSPCFYCGCNRVITRDHSKGAAYVARVLREADRIAPLLDVSREVIQLHLGGGTPNFLAAAQLRELVDGLGRRFSFSSAASRDFSIELDPRFVGRDDIAGLAALGFNRASLGIQDFDPVVQRAINREQGVEQTLDILRACREHGLRSVNVDLIYGLPHQTPVGFAQTLETVLRERPDRLAIYGYAHLPHLFKAQRQIPEAALPGPEQKLALLGLAVRRLSLAGYQYIGMDHFALPDEDLSQAQRAGQLHRNFMGYTTHADTDLIGLGASAISHVGDSYSQNPRDLPGWEAAVDAGRLPVWRGLQLDADDSLRADLIGQLMCQGGVDGRTLAARHGVDFDVYFADALQALQALQADGLAEYEHGVVRSTARGRPLLRLLAMCFDRYLARPDQPVRYSRAI
ncbi:oxygen-independent coproporphyrinogen III oxidase [Stenotrophomonas rhizophila]|uniref:oxygen-independent coproporphyrinogen III oxidase n=1 Tax=Stenotrophomonas rhizophila TaxID=216778 RepID=UPI001E32DD3A|nr:oxygen-independent coproporphyrinogen III oxidase [Stenotrophomonas rhizophila]MCC7635594.1 oxygen-independent coproporphyrinogen III oxidase [Stenotrophomonas rhizophila]MCC7665251.1 oxygen-independent coproporphyrinogen III oxidase [Stenotrophomonas rhizophila]